MSGEGGGILVKTGSYYFDMHASIKETSLHAIIFKIGYYATLQRIDR